MRRRTLRTAASALMAVAALGCGSTTSASLRMGRAAWETAVRTQRLDLDQVVYPYATTPEMERYAREFLDRYPSMGPVERLKKLQRLLFDTREFPFEYDEKLTLTGSEAFARRQGNCMAFTAMFIGLTRAMGMNTFLVSVRRPPEVAKEDDLVVVNRHVVAGYLDSGHMNVFDFYLVTDLPYMNQRVIDDVRASAMFHSNLGGAAIRSGDLEAAIHHLEVAVALEPTLASAWINLGVARNRAGDSKGALEAYQRAVHLDPENSSALTNMAYVYRHLGQAEQARNALFAASKRGSTPFTLIALADAEMARGNLDRARGYLFRARRMDRKIPEVFDSLARLAALEGDSAAVDRYHRRADKLRRALSEGAASES